MAAIRESFDLAAVTAWPVVVQSSFSDLPTIESKELVGIEVEVENVTSETMGAINPVWNTKGDGSLRNNGLEFISRPHAACDSPMVIAALMRETLKPMCSFSPRTSVHIHMNFQNDQLSVAEDVVLLYTVFERLFYNFVGKQRIKNIYCVPLTETNLLKSWGRNGFRAQEWHKYTGLNARPLREHGTLEFRHMHGTFNAKKLCVWIDLITRLKTYCLKVGTTALRKMLAEMDDDFDFKKLINDIFGDAAFHLKYQSVNDVKFTYQTMKLVLCKDRGESRITYSSDSMFYKLRNLK